MQTFGTSYDPLLFLFLTHCPHVILCYPPLRLMVFEMEKGKVPSPSY